MSATEPRAGTGPLVKAEGLGHVYLTAGSKVVALEGLDLEVAEGETIAIIGPSGSGKTTLINILAAVHRPSHGRLEVAGHDLGSMSEVEREDYRRRVVGYLWQQSEIGLWPGLSALDNVQVPMLGEPGSRRRRQERAARLLDLVRLPGQGLRGAEELDYGERQRLALAVALANQPRLLLCDEPTAELDGHTAQSFLTDLSGLLRNLGLSAVLVTHDPQLERHVDRVVKIRELGGKSLPFAAAAGRTPSLRLLRQEAGGA